MVFRHFDYVRQAQKEELRVWTTSHQRRELFINWTRKDEAKETA